MIRRLIVALSALLVFTPFVALAQTGQSAIARYESRYHPVYDTEGMVASQNAVASRIGAQVLADGGNAIDAAVAVGFALAVTLPRAGNIGGGGFLLAYIEEEERSIAIDYREMAPPTATRDMYLDENGDADPAKSRFGHQASAVPGTVAGLWLAHSEYGKLPWERLLMPAIGLARDGILVSWDLSTNLQRRHERLSTNDATRQYYYKPGGETYEPGERLIQSDLANSLELIATNGPDAFYKGEIAELIVADMEANGGLIDREALANYKPAMREPITGTYRGYDIVSMPPSSSGGIHIIQMLNILEHFPVAEMGVGSADSIHLLTEVSRRAFADRSEHLGDMDFYDVPIDWLTSKEYAGAVAANIDMKRATPSSEIKPGVAPIPESEDTTQYSIMDKFGNAVSNTYTLNFSYGSGISVPGAGFLMNNEMDDFVSKPGVPNAFGLLGGEANSIRGNKRPLSSMTPTLVFKDGSPYIATGSPGGSRIITTVLQMLVNVMDHNMNIADAASAPRMHHQWYPDQLRLESGISPDTVQILQSRGHEVASARALGSLQTVAWKDGVFMGHSDPRRPSAGAAGPSETQ